MVLRQGSLARAMRASLTIPAVIAPVEIDGRLLVDGGIANNLPVDVAREMGAEIIIAVDVSTGLLERDGLNSVIDVTNQLINILGRDSDCKPRWRRWGPTMFSSGRTWVSRRHRILRPGRKPSGRVTKPPQSSGQRLAALGVAPAAYEQVSGASASRRK